MVDDVIMAFCYKRAKITLDCFETSLFRFESQIDLHDENEEINPETDVIYILVQLLRLNDHWTVCFIIAPILHRKWYKHRVESDDKM